MENPNYSNRRQLERYALRGSVQAIERSTGESLGMLVNITTEGLMLINNQPLETDRIYHVVLKLPDVIGGSHELALSIDCLWTNPTSHVEGLHWTGCYITDIEDKALNQLEQLIQWLGK